MQPRLIVVSGPAEGRTLILDQDQLTIGRHPESGLQLLQAEVSRHHCYILRNDLQWMIHDCESRVGTFVNEVPVREQIINHTDVIRIGGTTLLFMLYHPVSEQSVLAPGELAARSTLHQHPDQTVFLQPEKIRSLLTEGGRIAAGLHLLLRISTLQPAYQVDELGERLLTLLLEALPAERAGLLLLTPGDDEPVLVASRSDGSGEPFAVSRTVLRRVLEQRIGLLCNDLELAETGLAAAESLHHAHIRSLLCAPLIAHEQVRGALYLDTRHSSNVFTEHDLELLTAAANITALTIAGITYVQGLQQENRRLQAELLEHGIIGESPAVKRLLELVRKVAAVDSTVLIRGESGTGKELVARALHQASPRAGQPFVAVNCATLSETLLESELFGHERGAFTGAVARKLGKLEAADRGTLFLDEVGEIPVGLQAKLLRVLQEKEIERVGGTRPIKVDLRLLAATNRDLEAALSDGSFRDDLYYRLDVITLQVPPLRERGEDITLLARHFAARHGRELRQRMIALTAAARQALAAYDWPGNVRQLANAIERAVVLCDGELIRPEDLPDEIVERAGELPAGDFQAALTATKKRLILAAFETAGGDHNAAAEQLGLHPNSLRRLLRTLGLREEMNRRVQSE